jgi:capsular exopolysaccharide synthesis family protein
MGDGKTTTAINLAGALAQASDARVLLIDVDLRHPAVGGRLDLADSTPGLVDAIQNPALTLDDVVRPRPPFNLSVLPAGSPMASPYELLKSPRLGQLLEEARLQYDYVVLDTPPLVPIPDCRIVGRHVDGFLVVVAAHKTRAKLLDEALAVISSSKILGLVFNGGENANETLGYGSYTERPRPGAMNGSRPWYRAGRSIDRLLLRPNKPDNHEESWP